METILIELRRFVVRLGLGASIDGWYQVYGSTSAQETSSASRGIEVLMHDTSEWEKRGRKPRVRKECRQGLHGWRRTVNHFWTGIFYSSMLFGDSH